MAPVSGRALRSARPLLRATLAAAATALALGAVSRALPPPEVRAPYWEYQAPADDLAFARADLPGYVFIGPSAPAVENPCLGVIAAWNYVRDRALTIRRGAEELRIEPSGAMVWTQPGEPPRAAFLDDAGRARLLAASGASCDVRDAADPRHVTVEAADAHGRFARTAPGSSDAHAHVARFFDDLEVAWLRARIEEHGVLGAL